ncbi:MAG: FTR1 family protein [Burkholderiales bacterium]|nr:FTR1 family protein [Burkholderiales bacterium]
MRTLLWLVLLVLPLSARLAQAQDNAQAILNMLDYVSVEYPEFVIDGKVVDEEEYAEQVEFSSQVKELVAAMPAAARHQALIARADELAQLVRDKADGARVVMLARALQHELVAEYDLVVAPKTAPDLAAGARLYQANCATCHGASGNGRGPAAEDLEPRPTDFTDRARASARSVFGLYNTISLGVEGTSMPAFSQLTDEQRWALAFHVSTFSAEPALIRSGEAAWRKGDGRAAFPDLAAVVTTTPAEARGSGVGNDAALAYQRQQPQAVTAAATASPLDFSLTTLAHSLEAVRSGRRDEAYRLAVTAYLEGFELAEPALANRDRDLLKRTEQAMMTYRNAIRGSSDADVEAAYERAVELLQQAKAATSDGTLSAAAGFISSLVIILREGLEAIIVVAAMAAFLVKTGRPQGMRWLHAGWITALLLGGLTWIISSTLISISGAQREVTEGVTALLSAAVLLYVGFWLHNKSNAMRWSAFIREKMAGTGEQVGVRAGLGVALVVFLAVYREVFETVLFYQALWTQAEDTGRSAVLIGLGAGALALVVLAWLIIRFSVRLPLSLFFGVSSLLLAIMAVVFAGQGVAALQEAGKLPLSPLDIPAIPLLGIYPNLQGIGLQLVLVATIAGGWYLMREQSRHT